ncbi:RDD family protein [Euzebya sp.]|uniref:RDD family protein n=1 Tax=Euzebya sp. TaxID=1971409 RepID=UPI0035121AB8
MADGPHRSPVDRLVGPVRDAILDQIDPDDILARVDPNAVLDRVDPNALLDRVDPDALLDRVDPDRLLERVDVNRLLDRVDVDRLLDRVDVDRLMDRVDVDRVVRRVDVDRIVAASTGGMLARLVDIARRQVVGLDTILVRTVLRLRGIDLTTIPDGPPALVEDGGERGRYEVTGRYAGPVSRLLANGADVAAAFGLFTALSAGAGYLASLLLGIEFDPQGVSGSWGTAALVVVLFAYSWLSVAVAGRTPAMAVLGLRVVSRQGRPLSTTRAAIRTLVLPLSALAFGLGFLGLLLSRERLGWHDLAAGSTVVYDWGDRPASLPTPLGDWLERHAHDDTPAHDTSAHDTPAHDPPGDEPGV